MDGSLFLNNVRSDDDDNDGRGRGSVNSVQILSLYVRVAAS